MPLDLRCRYYRVYTDPDMPCEEKNFGYVERTLSLAVEETALVLVDVWSTHYIDSWLNRARKVTAEKIVPLLHAARAAGMTVIHGPSPFIADRYLAPPSAPTTLHTGPDWPPAAFRGIYRSGPYAAFGRNPEPILPPTYKRYETELDISPLAKPLP
ncbi:MAG: hypothetical protein FJY97_06180 [candidate division Zixibacteria bacterium]|nr:hypothetical protein [candidate division Zixibacteria bacterium]